MHIFVDSLYIIPNNDEDEYYSDKIDRLLMNSMKFVYNYHKQNLDRVEQVSKHPTVYVENQESERLQLYHHLHIVHVDCLKFMN